MPFIVLLDLHEKHISGIFVVCKPSKRFIPNDLAEGFSEINLCLIKATLDYFIRFRQYHDEQATIRGVSHYASLRLLCTEDVQSTDGCVLGHNRALHCKLGLLL
jgi:hypothetical protein